MSKPSAEPPAEQATLQDTTRCPACSGNDRDAPCAYPSEGRPGCLRDQRLRSEQAPLTVEDESGTHHLTASGQNMMNRALRRSVTVKAEQAPS